VKSESGKQIRAMKVLNKKTEVKEDMGFVVAEIEAMVRLDHPNIAKFIQFFEDNKAIYLVSELCDGGDFSKVGRSNMSRREVRLLFQDVFRGVAYCHDQDIAHRDLKFENCMLCRGSDQGRRVAKVIDFGLSSIKADGASDLYMKEQLGTKYFVAPEVIDKQVELKGYGVKCDIWSLGVMMYIILTKEHPFAENATKLPSKELFRKIRGESMRLRPLDQAQVELSAVELLKGQPGLLTRCVEKRLGAASALKKDWLNVGPDPSRSLVTQTSEVEMLSRLVTYRNMSRFEKTVLMMVAHQADMQLVEELKEEFIRLDTQADGSLTMAELKVGLDKCGTKVSQAELRKSFDSVDLNLNQKIDYSEWLSATIAPSSLNVDAAMEELFQFFDHDQNGKVEMSELVDVVGEEEADSVFQVSDVDHDGTLSREEFRNLMHQVADRRRQVEGSSLAAT
jgi:calcium-dependent protein kinase